MMRRMKMNNIIKCDFHRTERRKEMKEIENKVAQLMQSLYTSLDFTDIDITSIEEVNKLDKKYTELLKEENEWGHLKWGK